VTEQHRLAVAIAEAFGLVEQARAHPDDGVRFATAAGRRSRISVRAGGLSLRHAEGWTLVVCGDGRGCPTRAEVAGCYPSPEAIARLRRADQRLGGALGAVLAGGTNRHTRFVHGALADG
jgi:hypothetical protein